MDTIVTVSKAFPFPVGPKSDYSGISQEIERRLFGKNGFNTDKRDAQDTWYKFSSVALFEKILGQ